MFENISKEDIIKAIKEIDEKGIKRELKKKHGIK